MPAKGSAHADPRLAPSISAAKAGRDGRKRRSAGKTDARMRVMRKQWAARDMHDVRGVRLCIATSCLQCGLDAADYTGAGTSKT
ncbi:MAG: hypothetical protein MO853_00740 [Candidatus Protistobacter heckmanni]|nr:hypothetical protein [Candidatus Protistobacter heckmanni]